MIQNNCMWFLLLFLNVSFKQGNILVKIPDPLHGIVGTPAVWATMEDAILSPRAHIAPSGGPVIKEKGDNSSWADTHCQRTTWRKHFPSPQGRENNWFKILDFCVISMDLPIKMIPFLCRSSGNLGFSEAWPQPAHTACKNVNQQLSHWISNLKFLIFIKFTLIYQHLIKWIHILIFITS